MFGGRESALRSGSSPLGTFWRQSWIHQQNAEWSPVAWGFRDQQRPFLPLSLCTGPVGTSVMAGGFQRRRGRQENFSLTFFSCFASWTTYIMASENTIPPQNQQGLQRQIQGIWLCMADCQNFVIHSQHLHSPCVDIAAGFVVCFKAVWIIIIFFNSWLLFSMTYPQELRVYKKRTALT